MQIGPKLSVLVLGALPAVVLGVLAWAPSSSAREPIELFRETFRCVSCHSVKAEALEAKTKSEKIRGRDLSGYKPRAGVDIVGFLRKKTRKAGELHSVGFKGTDEELQAILDWLGSLEARG